MEHASVHGNYYGTSYAALEAVLSTRNIVLDIDTRGLASLRKREAFRNRMQAILITLPSFNDIEKRLRARSSETEESIAKRLATAKDEMRFFQDNAGLYDHVIVNDSLEESQ